MVLSRETGVNKLLKILLQVVKGRVQNRVAGRCSAPPRIDSGGDARNNPPPPFPTPIHTLQDNISDQYLYALTPKSMLIVPLSSGDPQHDLLPKEA
jgi:hypothetical protein